MNTDTLINWIGLVSAAMISIMFFPQVVQVHKTKDTHAINYTFLGINVIASILGLIYSIHFNIVPMIVANTSAGLFSVSLAGMKLVNELKEEPHEYDISTPDV
jgi:uncharacterized protein with PQ loop repeat